MFTVTQFVANGSSVRFFAEIKSVEVWVDIKDGQAVDGTYKVGSEPSNRLVAACLKAAAK